ncbi:MAG: response regulator [Pyrinomonadaceae bacterium]
MAKVLIIEDETNMAIGLKDSCEYEGYEVSVARDGNEGLEKASTEKPDIILLDVMLPLMSGIDVCRTLRTRGIEIPILMLTARSQEIDKVVGLEIGADDYVTKPFALRNCSRESGRICEGLQNKSSISKVLHLAMWS